MEFPVKCIKWSVYEQVSPILLQVSNGPCPLIALVNTLLLEEDISQRSDKPRPASELAGLRRLLMAHVGGSVACADVIASLGDILLATPDLDQTVLDNLLNSLPLLHKGLEVNPNLVTGRFQDSDLAAQVFSAFGLQFVHGWCIDPNNGEDYCDDENYGVNYGDYEIDDETAENYGIYSEMEGDESEGEDESEKGVNVKEEKEKESSKDMKENVKEESLKNMKENVKEESLKNMKENVKESKETLNIHNSADATPQKNLVIDNGVYSILSNHQDFNSIQDYLLQHENDPYSHHIQNWLTENSTQLTSHGLQLMHQQVVPETVAIFFRNNHFSTLYKTADAFYLLITDTSFDKSAGYVWQSLTSISGANDMFYTGDFTPISESSNVPGERYELGDSEDMQVVQKIQEEEDSNYAAILQKQYDQKTRRNSERRPKKREKQEKREKREKRSKKLDKQKSTKTVKSEVKQAKKRPGVFQRLKSDCIIM